DLCLQQPSVPWLAREHTAAEPDRRCGGAVDKVDVAMARDIAVVMGNGTSVVFNDRLTGEQLAKAVRSRLPLKARTFLTAAAKRATGDSGGGDPTTNFEHLLGPLDRIAAALGEPPWVLWRLHRLERKMESWHPRLGGIRLS
ncbi:MAG TPA: hypothetical protein VHF69_01590, partial [Candidatus Synoicihabitans sp.]|nr:hypothetical protein [Candidatus Synoicihabitans sp.]